MSTSIFESLKTLERKLDKIIRDINFIKEDINLKNTKDGTTGQYKNTKNHGYNLFKENCINLYEKDKNSFCENVNIWLMLRRIDKVINEEIHKEWDQLTIDERDNYNIQGENVILYTND